MPYSDQRIPDDKRPSWLDHVARLAGGRMIILVDPAPTPTGRFRLYRVDATYYRNIRAAGVTYVRGLVSDGHDLPATVGDPVT